MSDMNRDSRLTVRMTERTRTALEKAADSERRSTSDLLVIILDDWLAARGFLPKAKPKKAR